MTVLAIASSLTWDLLESMALDTSIVRSQALPTGQVSRYGAARSPRFIEKSPITCNIAMVFARTGRPDEAVTWYDHAAAYDPPTSTFFAAEEKAAILHTHHRWHEAMATYAGLLAMPDLPEDARQRIKHNVGVLRGDV